MTNTLNIENLQQLEIIHHIMIHLASRQLPVWPKKKKITILKGISNLLIYRVKKKKKNLEILHSNVGLIEDKS